MQRIALWVCALATAEKHAGQDWLLLLLLLGVASGVQLEEEGVH